MECHEHAVTQFCLFSEMKYIEKNEIVNELIKCRLDFKCFFLF